MVEQNPKRHLHPENPGHLGDEPNRQEGVTTEIEEIVGSSDVFPMQSLGPQAGEHHLLRTGWGLNLACRRLAGGRKPPTVHLPVRGQWQSGHPDQN